MAKKDKQDKSVGFAPADFSGEPQPLNLNDKKAVSAIHELSFEDFAAMYSSPPKDTDGYLDMRRLPSAWLEAVSSLPENHLFLYSFCLASADKRIGRLQDVRGGARQQCRATGNEAGLLWLGMRPKYGSCLIVGDGRRKFPSWNADVRDWFISLAWSVGITGRVMLIVYSSKVVLGSSTDLGKLRRILSNEVTRWDRWIEEEIEEISQFFTLKQG